jgi:hypothetical protein
MQNKLEKPKHKHNKKRNTAFLFESLVKELTKAVIYEEKHKQIAISGLIKEFFNKNNVLNKELCLYKQLYETKDFPKEIAEKLIDAVKQEHDKLNENDIYNEQSRLIAKVNKSFGAKVYDNFVPNYKTLATISQIFNKNVEAKQKVLLEQELLGNITGKLITENKKTDVYDATVINRFVDRFNETYNESLLEEQKELLTKYINHSEDDLEFKVYLNEEITRLKSDLEQVKNSDTTGNVAKINESLNSFKFSEINDDLIKKVMYVQQFLHEVKA